MIDYDSYNPFRLSEHLHLTRCSFEVFCAVSSERTYGFETYGWMGRLAATYITLHFENQMRTLDLPLYRKYRGYYL